MFPFILDVTNKIKFELLNPESAYAYHPSYYLIFNGVIVLDSN